VGYLIRVREAAGSDVTEPAVAVMPVLTKAYIQSLERRTCRLQPKFFSELAQASFDGTHQPFIWGGGLTLQPPPVLDSRIIVGCRNARFLVLVFRTEEAGPLVCRRHVAPTGSSNSIGHIRVVLPPLRSYHTTRAPHQPSGFSGKQATASTLYGWCDLAEVFS
jgi:hypothetical protein